MPCGCYYERADMLTLTQLRTLRAPVRALIYLFWIYSFVTAVVGVFMQIYVYQLFNSVQLNIVAGMLDFTGLMLGFCIYGVLAARFNLNARYGFLLGFVCTTIGIFALSMAKDMYSACIAMTISGFGGGFFWLTIHTYELVETHDHERDVYSTYLAAGERILSLLGPAFATFLIAAAHVLGWGEFTLLFIATPLVFLLGFKYFSELSDYRPRPIYWRDVRHFLSDRRNRIAQLYLFGGGSMHILLVVLLPLVSVTILGSALNVGQFNTVFAVVGALALLAVGAYRHEGNRLLILGVTSVILAILSVMLGYWFTFVALVVFTLGASIVQPLMRVSEHVIDLHTMGSIGHSESDFYPTMIFRDVSLWMWRMAAGVVLLVLVSFTETNFQALSWGMYLAAGAIVIVYIGARTLLSLQTAVTVDVEVIR